MTATAEINGSHFVEIRGDRVVIHSVPLFCAYHPKFDSADNKGIRYYSNSRTSEIIQNTQARIRNKQFPRVVLRHDRPGRTVDPTAIGLVPKVWETLEDGVVYMYGDLEMSMQAFEANIMTDAYPRRSAEFEPNTLDYLTNIALLGREAPGRPLADTRFAFESSQISLERPLAPITFATMPSSEHDSGIGAGANTYIPGPVKDKDQMEDIKSIHEAIGTMQKSMHDSFEKLDGRLTKLECDYAKKDQHEADGEDEDTGDTDTSATQTRKRGRPPKKASDPNFVPRSQFESLSSQLEEERDKTASLHERVSEFELRWRRAAAERMIDGAIAQGFSLKHKRDALVSKLVGIQNEKDAIAEFELIKSLARMDPIGNLPVFDQLGRANSGFPQDDAPLSEAEKMKASDNAVAMFEAKTANGEKTTYDACLAEARKAVRGHAS